MIVLFFKCISTLLDHRTGRGVSWGLMAYTIAMFLFVTVYNVTTLNLQSLSFIDNRGFPGVENVSPPGPLGYQQFIYSEAIGIVPEVMWLLNTWLANGLLVSFVSIPVTQVSHHRVALSLLYHLCYELLGNRLPVPHVSYLIGYVLQN